MALLAVVVAVARFSRVAGIAALVLLSVRQLVALRHAASDDVVAVVEARALALGVAEQRHGGDNERPDNDARDISAEPTPHSQPHDHAHASA